MNPPLQMLDALFGRTEGGFVELRCLNRTTARATQEWHSTDDLPQAADAATALQLTHNVYVGVAPRNRRAGGKDAVAELHALWADIDTPEALVELAGFACPPSMLIGSGSPGGHHAYWLLDEAIDVSRAEELLRRIAERLQSDPNVTDAGRILRVPGTLNHKHDPPVPVTLIDVTADRYTVDQLDAALSRGETEPAAARSTAQDGRQASAHVELALSRLARVTPCGSGWKAACPAHDDVSPSLSIGQGDDGRCLVHCFAGCTPEAVANAMGLELRDLAPGGHARRSGQDRLLELVASRGVELFHDPQDVPYARLTRDGHAECHEIASTSFRRWIRGTYWKEHGKTVSGDALGECLDLLAAQAQFDGPCEPVYRRVGGDLEHLCIDLGDETWRVASVRDDGTWQILDRSPVAFARDGGTLPLPEPVTGGSLDCLRDLVNVPDDDTWTLTRGALLAMFHPSGPYFVTLVNGVAGSGKTSLARYLAQLCDPSAAQFMRGSPRARDVLLAASKSWLVGFDNVSLVNREISDLLCVLSTGAGDRTRTLYTTADVHALEVKRPALVTSIGRVATRPDLVDRGLPISIEQRIPDHMRRQESALAPAFEAVRPLLFGAILDALAVALQHLPSVELPSLPRMADVTAFVTAAERGLSGTDGSFYDALAQAQGDALAESIEASPFIDAVLKLMLFKLEWAGTATKLWEEARESAGDSARGRWPSSASVASKELDEHDIALAQHGIVVRRERRPGGKRVREITLVNTVLRDAGRGGTEAART